MEREAETRSPSSTQRAGRRPGALARPWCGPARGLTRRELLQGAGAGALALWLYELAPRRVPRAAAAEPLPRPPAAAPRYRNWEDVYRERWQWDRVARGTHFVNCWYQAHCAFNVYVKDGLVWREEQAADYPATAPDLPDYNPRGCQKGACYAERTYSPVRVKYPLKRVGARGEGRWKRITWEEALAEFADAIIDVVTQEGPEQVVWSPGPLYTFGSLSAGHARLSRLLDSTNLDMNPEIGDGHPGAAVTFGKIVAERSADDYLYSDVILIWGCNPVVTQIPNAHFLNEARYRGATVVTVSPDYSPSALHADLWIPVRPGTDAALALGMARVIVAENLYDAEFVREQTDLPLLVCDDTRRLLRESDLERGGSEDTFYFFDEAAGRIASAPMRSLALGSARPALAGARRVKTLRGEVTVRPVFDLLRRRLEEYRPERVAAITGVSPALIRHLARLVGRARAVSNVTGSNFSKCYHGNLIERALIVVFALCGHMGKRGSGYSAFPFLTHDGLDRFAMAQYTGALGKLELSARFMPGAIGMKLKGFTEEMVAYEFARRFYREGRYVSGTLFWNIHGGLLAASGRSAEWDPHLRRAVGEVLEESLAKGWQYISPARGRPPRVVVEFGGNILRRIRAYPLVIEHLLPELRLLVSIDWRMTTTALYSDLVLPAAGWYERTEHKWVTPLVPFIHAGAKIVDFGEARSDWAIFAALAKTIQERARRRGATTFRDRDGHQRRLDTVYDDFSYGGKFGEADEDAVCAELLRLSSNVAGVGWEDLKRRGYARFTGVGGSPLSVGNACDIRPGETLRPFTWHVEKKQPYPTTTRRIQFYIDQELYLELGEELPVHKEPPAAGGNYPLVLSGGHTRWSIHAAWRDDPLMLRQQRGVPVMYVSIADARARGIEDGEEVEVRNDIASFRVRAKLSRALRPGQLLVYHAWENYQFPGGKGYQDLIPSPLNPVELAGGQFHLRPSSICLHPGQNDRDTRVEVVKIRRPGGASNRGAASA